MSEWAEREGLTNAMIRHGVCQSTAAALTLLERLSTDTGHHNVQVDVRQSDTAILALTIEYTNRISIDKDETQS